MDPFFSIVIPTFNAEKTISQCLKSITDQNFLSFEVLIVDGGSHDGTLAIVDQFKSSCNVIFSSEMDNGIYDAMNRGLKKAKGRYFYFIGADDYLFGSTVLKSVYDEIIKMGNPEYVYGNVLWGQGIKVYDGHFDIEKLYNRNICHQAIFYNRDIFSMIGVYNLSFDIYSDWHLNFRCFVDDRIRKIYLNQIIAVFSLGGKSSEKEDRTNILNKMKKDEFIPLSKKAGLAYYLKLKSISMTGKEFFFLPKYFCYKTLSYFFSWFADLSNQIRNK